MYRALSAVTPKQQGAHSDAIWAVSWASTDKIVTGSVDESAKCWVISENNNLELKHTFSGHILGVVSTAISSDGKILATSSLDTTIRLWDLETNELLREIQAGPVETFTIAFSPDGQSLASGSQSGNINIWDVTTGEKTRTLESHDKFAMSLAFSPDGKILASGHMDGKVVTYDFIDGKVKTKISAHAKTVRSLSFTNDSQILLTASDDQYVNMFDVSAGRCELMHSFSGHTS